MHSNKVLRPYTIIPRELYINRNADRQVESILSDMGRPGYVLVSRQMGKTNLLLNAKRKLERTQDAFVYIDLSNEFADARGCFENIIDVALDSYPDRFPVATEKIISRRDELRIMPPHKQHTAELRYLLNELNEGKLVIILDEIDALTKTTYSDQIFSQVRSVYFGGRVNYPAEFNRLTYLLSGVAEPNEIIKNPKISPFNIGQKIYLNDFSKAEFAEFLEASGLDLPADIADRVYFWTNGNPRLSWDICSAIEDLPRDTKIDSLLIDALVRELYLTSFDKPPIDNIREIVAKDKEVRNALIEMSYGKGKEISDKIKSRLYLVGIINYDEADIRIKNEIIKCSLGIEWIRSIDEQERGVLATAVEHFDAGRYTECIASFAKFLETESFDPSKEKTYQYYIGVAHTKISQFNAAIEWLSKSEYSSRNDIPFSYFAPFYKAISFHALGRINESIANFKIALKEVQKDRDYTLIATNYAITLMRTGNAENFLEAIEIFTNNIKGVGKDGLPLETPISSDLKSISYHYLAQDQAKKGTLDLASEYYRNAINLAKPEKIPSISIDFLTICKHSEESVQILERATDAIATGSFLPTEHPSDSVLDYSVNTLFHVLLFCYKGDHTGLLLKLFSNRKLFGPKPLGRGLLDFAIFAYQDQNAEAPSKKALLNLLNNLDNPDFEIDATTARDIKKTYALVSGNWDNLALRTDYFSAIWASPEIKLDIIDLNIFLLQMSALNKTGKFDIAIELGNKLSKKAQNNYQDLPVEYAAILNIEANMLFNIRKYDEAKTKATAVVTLLNERKQEASSSLFINAVGFNNLQENATKIINYENTLPSPIRKPMKFERNDSITVEYKSGTIKTGKYKKFEASLKSGDCKVLGSQAQDLPNDRLADFRTSILKSSEFIKFSSRQF